MKTRIWIIAIILTLLAGGTAHAAAGSCTQTPTNYPNEKIRQIAFVCTGSTVDGSIPDTATSSVNASFIKGYRLEQVEAYPTAGGTAPDAADVFILDAGGLDLLGSIDGSTTAYGGKNLIHASLKKAAVPHLYNMGTTIHAYYFPYITGALTLKVANQATVSANYTIVLRFFK